MSTSLFKLDIAGKTLAPTARKSLSDLGLTEPGDLEAWLASSGENLFGRQVLWLARQDRPSDEQRSDLIGIDQRGNLLVTELKRGLLTESAVTQALSYAAEYKAKTADDLAETFADQSAKAATTCLVQKAKSIEDAQSRLNAHVGDETEVNESQIIVLAAEDFSPNALAICDYLNGSSGQATFSLECWQYGVFDTGGGTHYFMLEQILPAPSVRTAIEEKREASKAGKYARDPVRMEFMRNLLGYLSGTGAVVVTRNQGQSYECRLRRDSWGTEHELYLSVHRDHPRLFLPRTLTPRTDLGRFGLTKSDKYWNGGEIFEFRSVDCGKAVFDEGFGKCLVAVVEAMEPLPTVAEDSP